MKEKIEFLDGGSYIVVDHEAVPVNVAMYYNQKRLLEICEIQTELFTRLVLAVEALTKK